MAIIENEQMQSYRNIHVGLAQSFYLFLTIPKNVLGDIISKYRPTYIMYKKNNTHSLHGRAAHCPNSAIFNINSSTLIKCWYIYEINHEPCQYIENKCREGPMETSYYLFFIT
ncbi:unnamed protein product, partial [Meganyctiphanes norvegica]